MDPYAILGLNPTATPEDIKRAWRRLARVHHPDRKGGNQEMMAQINLAYNLLMDEAARCNYDQGIGERRPPVDVRARQAIMQIVFAGLTQTQVQFGSPFAGRQTLHDWIKHHIRNNMDLHNGKIKSNEDQLKRTETELKNFLFKEPSNCIELVFSQIIDMCKENIQKAREDVETMVRANELYDEMVIRDSEAVKERELMNTATKLPGAKKRNPLLDGPVS